MTVPEVDVATLMDRHSQGGQVLDVREGWEYAEERVPGGQHIPLGEVVDRVSEIPSSGPLYVICRSGGRSLKATKFLRAQGIDAINVAGGTSAWAAAGYPVDAGE